MRRLRQKLARVFQIEDVGDVLRVRKLLAPVVVVQARRIHAVVSVDKLHDLPAAVTDRRIGVDRHVLEHLDHATLDVPRIGRFARGVRDALPARRRVEEKLYGI